MSLFEELKRRNVFRVGVAYVVGAWLLLQFTEVLTELLSLPPTVGPIVVAAVAIGFPVTVFFAWAFELTPEGIKRENEVDRSQSITNQTGKKLNAAIIAMLALALAYFIWESRFSDRTAITPEAGMAEQEVGAAADEPQKEVSRQSIAVLPFDNRSEQQSDAYFVAGIHDDLLTNLARIGDLKVISRTSMERYADTDKSIPEIAAELGVATVMEGAVQRAGNQVRINVQLIDAQTDEHLWAEIFDREMTADNLFAIQTEISQAIADALKATLTPEEQERISEQPTESLAAYNAYLRGRQYVRTRDSESLARARQEFERALDLDPEFAQAWVGLAEAVIYLAGYGTNPFPEALRIYGESADRALALNPALGEAWALKGAHSMMSGQRENADVAYRKAIELSPNDANVNKLYAEYLYQTPERIDESIAHIERAIELDPHWGILRSVRGNALRFKRDFEHADLAFRDGYDLNPNSAAMAGNLADFLNLKLDTLPEALTYARRAIELDPGSSDALYGLHAIYLNLGATEAAEEVRERLRDLSSDHIYVGLAEWEAQTYEGNFKGALESARWVANRTDQSAITAINLSLALAFDGQYARALELVLKEYPELEVPEAWTDWMPGNSATACYAGWLMQQAGEAQLGRGLSLAGLDYVETVLDPIMVDKHMFQREWCLAASGDHEAALSALEQRIEHGHVGEWWEDRYHPIYSDRRDDPRFHAVWARTEASIDALREKLVAQGLL
jgi:TolB-like protein/Flp pilus assembly protein TadD